jgi:hypothetical protein
MKIQGNFYELKSKKKSLRNLGTLDLNEIWPSSLLLLIARKNYFPSKEDQKVEFHSKWEI